jgi:hypothetical protein
MKKIFVAPVLALTIGLLAGCNPLSLLGDVEIGQNALPIDGKSVDVKFPDKFTASGLKAQAEETVNASKETSSDPFKDIDPSKIPGTIQKVIQAVGIAGVTLSGTNPGCVAATSPATVKVKINELSASVTDATTKKLEGKVVGSFTATKGASGYTVSDVVLSALSLTGDGSVLTGGGDNVLKVKLDASATSDPGLSSCTLTVKLSGGMTKVSF